MTLGKGLGVDRGRDRLTLYVQLGPPAVTLNEDGGAQEGGPAQGPDESTEHERELQGPELRQEGRRPAPAEAVGDLRKESQQSREGQWGEGGPNSREQRLEQDGKGFGNSRERSMASLWKPMKTKPFLSRGGSKVRGSWQTTQTPPWDQIFHSATGRC